MRSYNRYVEGGTGFGPNYIVGAILGLINAGFGFYFIYGNPSPWCALNFFIGLIFAAGLKDIGQPGGGDYVIEVKDYEISFEEIYIGAGVATIAIGIGFVLFVFIMAFIAK